MPQRSTPTNTSVCVCVCVCGLTSSAHSTVGPFWSSQPFTNNIGQFILPTCERTNRTTCQNETTRVNGCILETRSLCLERHHRNIYSTKFDIMVVAILSFCDTRGRSNVQMNQRSLPLVVRRVCSCNTWSIDCYTTRGFAPWWSGERMQLSQVHVLVSQQCNMYLRPVSPRGPRESGGTYLAISHGCARPRAAWNSCYHK